MKKAILVLAVAGLLAACNNTATTATSTDSTKVDSTKVITDSTKK